MNFQDFFAREVFNLWDFSVTAGNLTVAIICAFLLLGSLLFLRRKVFPKLYSRYLNDEVSKTKATRLIGVTIALAALAILFATLQIDVALIQYGDFSLSVATILQAVLIWEGARLLDLVFSKIVDRSYEEAADPANINAYLVNRKQGIRRVRYIVYVLALLFLIRKLHLDPSFSFQINQQTFNFQVSGILIALLIFLGAHLFLWILVNLALSPYYKQKKIEIGYQYSINRLLQYCVYVIAVLVTLQSLNIDMTLIWTGAAALLIGVGFGLQQTINDFFSGLLLLFERTVEVGDVLNLEGEVGVVKKIGLRTSLVETRENITLIVPNSKLVSEKVVNWSHFHVYARFTVGVGVAYGSDTKLVKELLLQAAKEHTAVLKNPEPLVWFSDFGDSALLFELRFYSKSFLTIEEVKSDLRFRIDAAFRQHKITIPFPQRDVWIKSNDAL